MTTTIKTIIFIVFLCLLNVQVYASVQEDEKLTIVSYESSCTDWTLSKDDIIAFFKNSYEVESMVLFYSAYVYYNENLPCKISGSLKLKDKMYSYKITQTGNGYIFGAINPPNEFDTTDRLFSCNNEKCIVINPLHGTIGDD